MTQTGMDPGETGFLSREELLGGMHAKRASTLLFAIESRTAQLVLESRQAVARYISDKAAGAPERAFMEALALGRDLPLHPTIQDLERYAKRWALLVSPEPGLRAVVAYLISQKYIFTYRAVPGLRHALALDDDKVKQEFERRYGFPLQDIYAPDVSRLERYRWIWSGIAYRLDNLPPFWMVFALTLTETIGASILALPIALAKIGPLAGLVELVILGAVNVLTIAGLAEAVARNGSVRYGNAYFGRVVTDYLGSAGSFILTTALLTLSFVLLMVYDVGVSSVLGGATPVPASVWAALLFLVQIYFLYRQALNATIASALIIGAVNIGLILLMALLAVPHIKTANLLYVSLPFVNGQPFDPSTLGLIFGVVLAAYFGHTSTGTSAHIVLSRDSSGRSLIWGAVSAMIVSIVLYSIWVIAVNGTLAPDVLAAQSGTALTPLAAEVGPIINVFGLAFVILGMGMGSIQVALALFNQVREWLPESRQADEPKSESPANFARLFRDIQASSAGRFWLGVLPIAFVFLVIEWMLYIHQESFTEPLSVLGTLAIPLIAGIFPVLMLVAARRRGEYVPATVFHLLGHRVVITVLYLVFLLSILTYGLIIWQDPIPRLLALTIGTAMVIATLVFARGGAFIPRAIVEIRVERNPEEKASFSVTSAGMPVVTDVQLRYLDSEKSVHAATLELEDFSRLVSATFQLQPTHARELKVWVHLVTLEGNSQKLPAQLQISNGSAKHEIKRDDFTGQTLFPLDPRSATPCQVEIAFS